MSKLGYDPSTVKVSGITAYLQQAGGWHLMPERLRGASIWSHETGYEVLVPGRDGMGDHDMRVWEILDTLAEVEQRPPAQIATDIQALG